MITRLLTLLAALGLFTTVTMADSAADLKQRMAQRLSAIDELKAKQVIGENNRGYVEVRQAAQGADAVVNEENRDREAVYASIAQKTSAASDAVGRARAKQIAANSHSGVWLQDEAGNWYKKK
jgi:hypothetical protein